MARLNKLLLGITTIGFLPLSLIACQTNKNSTNYSYDSDKRSYNVSGSNWSGYISGSVTMHLNNKNYTAYIEDNDAYAANNLIIPKTVVQNKIKYTVVPEKFRFISEFVTGTIWIPPSFTYIGGVGNDFSIYCENADTAIIPSTLTTLKSKCISVKNLVIPSTVLSVSADAFASSKNITSVTFLNTMTSIPSGIFYNCVNLTSVTLPRLSTVSKIENSAFINCINLVYIYNIPNNLTTVEFSAFEACSKLITFPIISNISSIGENAFKNCTLLTAVSFSPSVIFIQPSIFYGCKGLLSITIPSTVRNIGAEAFKGCATSLVEDEVKRNLYLPTTSTISEISNWTSGRSITLGDFTFLPAVWNISKI